MDYFFAKETLSPSTALLLPVDKGLAPPEYNEELSVKHKKKSVLSECAESLYCLNGKWYMLDFKKKPLVCVKEQTLCAGHTSDNQIWKSTCD